ncbi:hypothetical protein DNU06_08865 [Putridiphycobacter roseus]|uniref:Secretion system C-terminal sorting domain-containing protein n=1 Tax=Putridiphycobacter roseus TaxID=2219161 RepID=A0A2W1NP09_9FLAO|nr:T9SS type A sorting domain-containing protein [Putridiphycobacter roseus]PZE17372.1 hypothetical protein DNU06_08865 [Putridiphycobacter roseus]
MKQFFTLISALFIGATAMSQVAFQSDFSSWDMVSGNPADWFGAKTNIASSNVNEINFGVTYGTSMAQLINTGAGHKRFTSDTIVVTPGATYAITMWVRGLQGEVRAAFYDLSAGSSSAGYVYDNSNYESTATSGALSSISQNITIPITCDSIELILSLKNTDANGFALDSVSMVEYTNTAVPAQHTIYALQNTSTGPSSFEDSLTITSGVVTSINPGLGYWIQDGVGAFSGIFVEDNSNTPSRGDSVTVTGTVAENYDATQIELITNYILEPIPDVSPIATTLNTVDVQTQEEWEGVLIEINNATCTNINAGFGQWLINNGLSANDSLLVDDELYAYTPTLNTVYGVIGIGHYSYGDYKIIPRDINDIIGAIPPITVSIYAIQFTNNVNGDSPELGNSITTYGIVTGITGQNRYFIQDGAGAWNGIYVYDNTQNLAIGDSVMVTGTIDEFNGLTELTSVTAFSIINSGNSLPVATVVTTAAANAEEWEGVLVKVEAAECTDNNGGFNTWMVNDNSGSLIIDDDIFNYQSTAVIGNVYAITGIGQFGFSQFKILPRDVNDIVTTGYQTVDNQELDFFIYPNPAKQNVVIRTGENGTLKIFAMNGALLLTRNISNKSSIDVSGFKAGMYSVQLTVDGAVVTKKMMVY